MSSVLWLLSTAGVTSIGPIGIASITGLASLGAVAAKAQFDSIREQQTKERIEKEYDNMVLKKKKIDTDLFNEGKHKENETIKKDYEQMTVDKKERELQIDKMINTHIKMADYNGIKVDNYNDMLFGFDVDMKPIFLSEPNYCIVAPTRMGKTKRGAALLLNWLANKQGPVFIADLKRSDFRLLKGKNGVSYIDNLQQLKELVEAFKREFEYRQDIINDGNYIDVEDYNKQNPDKKLRSYLLYIEEFPRVSTEYSLPSGRPIQGSVYAEIISLSMLIGYTGGHIVITSQRGTVDFLSGGLKANINFIAMRTVDENNSKVVISVSGCERLRKSESLSIIDGKLTKAFSYNLTDDMFRSLCSKLK